eukprot:m.81619 g.81619  ORF g.81619 m.81619 type:complete len:363 (+) comp9418_c0_seq1:274-1362(+)
METRTMASYLDAGMVTACHDLAFDGTSMLSLVPDLTHPQFLSFDGDWEDLSLVTWDGDSERLSDTDTLSMPSSPPLLKAPCHEGDRVPDTGNTYQISTADELGDEWIDYMFASSGGDTFSTKQPTLHEASNTQCSTQDWTTLLPSIELVTGNTKNGSRASQLPLTQKAVTAAQYKAEKRARLEAEGWSVVAVQDHKDNYQRVINTNPKTRSIKQLKHMLDSRTCGPPRGYRGEYVQAVCVVDNTVEFVMWTLPQLDVVIIAHINIMHGYDRPDGKASQFIHPRYVIAWQVECPRTEGTVLWHNLTASRTAGHDTAHVVNGREAQCLLHDRVVVHSGCFYYGPMTTKYVAVPSPHGTLGFHRV